MTARVLVHAFSVAMGPRSVVPTPTFAPAFVACLLAVFSGCATVTRGSEDVLEIETKPSGAQVQTSNGMSCLTTPCALKMKRKSEIVVDINKTGCKPVRVNVTHRMAGGGSAAIAGNVLVGGLIGLGVDAATGASQELVPNPVKVELECRRR